MSMLIPTPIVNRLGVATTVHRSHKVGSGTGRSIPAPVAPVASRVRPVETIVRDWVHDHAGADLEAWVTAFIKSPYTERADAALTNIDNWDVEGAVGHVRAMLTDMAYDNELDEHDSVASVFGDSSEVAEYGKLHAALVDGYYFDPVSTWSMLGDSEAL